MINVLTSPRLTTATLTTRWIKDCLYITWRPARNFAKLESGETGAYALMLPSNSANKWWCTVDDVLVWESPSTAGPAAESPRVT